MNPFFKKYKYFTLLYILVFIGALFSQCAQIIPLSGGEKDVLPPRMVKSTPENASTDFKGNELIIEFDEYIQLRDLQNQLIITPKLKEQPDIQPRGKTLSLKFNETLKPNTTYSINFGNSIIDLHEGNKLSGYEFVFSTGSTLDSLKLTGQLSDAFTLEPVKSAWVMLYENTSDSVVFKEKPDYLAQTDDKGHYEVRYLKKGNYKVFALKDNNGNFLYDTGEAIAFPTATASTIEKNDTLNMIALKENPSRVYIKKMNQPYQGKAQIVFNTSPNIIDNILVKNKRASYEKENVAWSLSKQRDTINFYYRHIYNDTLTLYIRYNSTLIDSCKISIATKEEVDKMLSKKRMPFEVYPSFSPSQPYAYFKKIAFRSNRMLAAIKPGKILMTEENDTIRLASNNFKQQGPDSLYIDYTLKPEKEYKLLILPEAFADNEGNGHDTLRYKFKTQSADYYSSLQLKLELPAQQHWLIQLYNSKGQLQAEKTFSSVSSSADATIKKELLFDKIGADTYSLKLICDTNADGRYTPGTYINKTRSEKVYNYNQPIKILADWEAEIEWKLNAF